MREDAPRPTRRANEKRSDWLCITCSPDGLLMRAHKRLSGPPKRALSFCCTGDIGATVPAAGGVVVWWSC